MRVLCAAMLLCSLLLGLLPPTAGAEDGAAGQRAKRSLPYWGLWSSDFYGWLEELRARAAYDGMQDLARTFWAHFPVASELGYDSPEAEALPQDDERR